MTETRRDRLMAVIEEAIREARNDSKQERYTSDYVCDAVEKFMDAETAPEVVEPDAFVPYSCAACGTRAERPVRALLAPYRCDCGGMLIRKPEAQTTEMSATWSTRTPGNQMKAPTLESIVDDAVPRR